MPDHRDVTPDAPASPIVTSGEGAPATEREATSPARLWYRAEAEHGDDFEAVRHRYHELMVEHGHIVKREPGQSVNLPCGWPHRPEPEDVH